MSIAATIPFIPAQPEHPAAPVESRVNPAVTIYLELSHRGPDARRKSRFLSFKIAGTDDSTAYLGGALERLAEQYCGRCSAHRQDCRCVDGPVAPVESL